MKKSAALFVLCFSMCAAVSAAEYPLRADVESVDGIIQAYYDVVSGPGGRKRDLKRDESLHYPGAQVIVVKTVPDTGRTIARKMTLQQFHELSAPIFEQGIYETEIHRVQETFGAIVHVWSTYEVRSEPRGKVTNRGVNSIQLHHDGERYWITSWIYDAERPGHSLPAKYLPANEQPARGEELDE